MTGLRSLAFASKATSSVAGAIVDTTADFPTSWEKWREKEKIVDLTDYLLKTVDRVQAINFAVRLLAPELPSANQENVAIARRLGVSASTVENLRKGDTNCSEQLQLINEVWRFVDSPEDLVRRFSVFDNRDHSVHFEWMGEG